MQIDILIIEICNVLSNILNDLRMLIVTNIYFENLLHGVQNGSVGKHCYSEERHTFYT